MKKKIFNGIFLVVVLVLVFFYLYGEVSAGGTEGNIVLSKNNSDYASEDGEIYEQALTYDEENNEITMNHETYFHTKETSSVLVELSTNTLTEGVTIDATILDDEGNKLDHMLLGSNKSVKMKYKGKWTYITVQLKYPNLEKGDSSAVYLNVEGYARRYTPIKY